MNKTIKVLGYILFFVGIIAIIGVIVANKVLENKLIDFIEEDLPENISSSYGEISVNTLNGTAVLTTPNLILHNGENAVKHTFIKAVKLVISGFGYWNYFFKKEIHIRKITVER